MCVCVCIQIHGSGDIVPSIRGPCPQNPWNHGPRKVTA